ncbi:MAG: ribosome maturation factor RimM [Candidatus Gastranaerophilales bacterium]|nr:ribosome maturation factor RimM [Candidatus Gastranaerophilales bacterium]
MEELLSIGKILNFHGIHGEARVGYTANKEHQLIAIKKVYAVKDSKTVPLTIEKIRFHKTIAIIKFKEISTVNEVVDLKDAYIKVPKEQIENYLDENEYYIDDLIGLDAFDTENKFLGKIENVLGTNDEDILAIKDQNGEQHMVPFVKELVPEVRIKEKKVIINKIPGLFEEINE